MRAVTAACGQGEEGKRGRGPEKKQEGRAAPTGWELLVDGGKRTKGRAMFWKGRRGL